MDAIKIPHTDKFLEELIKRTKPGFQTELLQAYMLSPNQATLEKFLDERRDNPTQVVS
jgi:hypothetical protein